MTPTPFPSDSLLGARGLSFEPLLVGIWKRLLGVRHPGLRKDFFELGGDLPLAERMLAEVEVETGIPITVDAFLGAPCIVDLAGLLRDSRGARSGAHLVRMGEGDDTLPNIFILCSHHTNLLYIRYLSTTLTGYQLWGVLPTNFHDQGGDDQMSVTSLVQELLPLIEAQQPSGPLTLVGHCFGGLMAYEAACQLQARGREVDLVALLDTFTPKAVRPWQRLEDRLRKGQWRTIAQAGRRHLAAIGRSAPTAHSPERLPGDFNNEETLRLARRHRPGGYRGRLLLVASASNYANTTTRYLGWEDVALGEIRLRQVTGDHVSILVPPAIESVADEMEQGLGWPAEDVSAR